MKTGIHPKYETAKITCACGRVTETKTTVGEIHVEICSHCHPFFTGRQKLVDTAGRVERFMAKYGAKGSGGRAAPEAPAETTEPEEAEPAMAEPAEAPVPEAEGASEAEASAPQAEEARAADGDSTTADAGSADVGDGDDKPGES